MKFKREITKLYIKKIHGFICYPYLSLNIEASMGPIANVLKDFKEYYALSDIHHKWDKKNENRR